MDLHRCPRLASAVVVGTALVAGCSDAPTHPSSVLTPSPAVAASASDAEIEIVALETLGGRFGYATAVNESGTMAGVSSYATGGDYAVTWSSDGKVTELKRNHPRDLSYALGLNNHGAVVGCSASRAVMWLPGGGLQDLAPDARYRGACAADINDAGVVVGYLFVDAQHAFVWTPEDGMRDLGTLPGGENSSAQSINESGEIAGISQDATGVLRAVIWRLDGSVEDLGALPGARESFARDINEHSVVAGRSGYKGVLWSGGAIRTLDGFSEGFYRQANGINDDGVSVGEACCFGAGITHGALWSPEGRIIDLGVLPGYTTSSALDNNNAGLAVGYSRNNTEWRPVLWNTNPVVTVALDVKPGSTENPINRKAGGVIPAAVLSTQKSKGEVADFDATTADVGSVEFAPGKAKEVHAKGHPEDADGDGDLDLVLHFEVQAAQLPDGATEVCLTGKAGGKTIKGCDAIRLIK